MSGSLLRGSRSGQAGRRNASDRLNPDGNDRLTSAVGLLLIILTLVELATVVFGLRYFLSLHVFVDLC